MVNGSKVIYAKLCAVFLDHAVYTYILFMQTISDHSHEKLTKIVSHFTWFSWSITSSELPVFEVMFLSIIINELICIENLTAA